MSGEERPWRPTQPGDLFILLIPSPGEDIPAIQLQCELQTYFGGKPIDPVHITCDRFALDDSQMLDPILRRLALRAAEHPPFPVTATSVMALESGYRGGHILKWLVHLSLPLQQWIEFVRACLDDTGAHRFYSHLGDRWTVTALQNIDQLDTAPFLSQAHFPQHLFTASQLLVSKIHSPHEHETLGLYDLAGV